MRRIATPGGERASGGQSMGWQSGAANSPLESLSLAALRDLGMTDDAIAAYFNDDTFPRKASGNDRRE
jgi:hypothetical protein